MARHGIVHAEYLVEFNGEGLLLFAKIHPYLDAIRKAHSPRAFVNAEWVATNTEMGKKIFASFQERFRKG
jgi:hypothetical protein